MFSNFNIAFLRLSGWVLNVIKCIIIKERQKEISLFSLSSLSLSLSHTHTCARVHTHVMEAEVGVKHQQSSEAGKDKE
jgi:hypothetical protein